ncbi:flagellar biosynthesis regulator FlhF [Carboxydothermus islandicus]|uniref:Flagellar biosynthesis protein FlhF n=1 Tax=Carboxydothermus islandicus TaxID=661089 RepID=A0A1L8D4Y0_9THEO|nr:flagellar biosynthesis protein FlhF [Carboxydothermus islandicus]GAV26174.1 flagellar biosynthesis regulator FlhF [Carboxydothermus islandicus]
MKIKKYTARDMAEALQMIKFDLGPEAMILESRKVRQPGILGFFKPPVLEVLAAVDEEAKPRKEAVKETFEVKKDLAELKLMVKDLARVTGTETGNFARWRERLLKLELAPDIVEQILLELQDFLEEMAPEETHGVERVKEYLINLIKPYYDNIHDFPLKALIGPTGVGKTTTLAKIAGRLAIHEEKPIRFITLDTFRVGAVEQLKIYGKYLGTTVKVAGSPMELWRAVQKQNEGETIFIDTAGRPSKKQNQIQELAGFLEAVKKEKDIYLVISATVKPEDAEKIAKDFSPCGFNKFIVTKIDETDKFGVLINLIVKFKKPIVYLGVGQNVPDDLISATPEIIVEQVWKGW